MLTTRPEHEHLGSEFGSITTVPQYAAFLFRRVAAARECGEVELIALSLAPAGVALPVHHDLAFHLEDWCADPCGLVILGGKIVAALTIVGKPGRNHNDGILFAVAASIRVFVAFAERIDRGRGGVRCRRWRCVGIGWSHRRQRRRQSAAQLPAPAENSLGCSAWEERECNKQHGKRSLRRHPAHS